MPPSTVLYVHGAGNRTAEADTNLAALRAGFGMDPTQLVRSDWGNLCGPPIELPDMDRTLPPDAPSLEGSESLAELDAREQSTAGRKAASQVLGLLSSGVVDTSTVPGVTRDLFAQSADAVCEAHGLRGASWLAVKDDADVDVQVRYVEAAVAEVIAAVVPPNVTRWPWDGPLRGVIAQVLLLGASSAILGATGVVSGLITGALLWATKELAKQRSSIMHDHHLLIAFDVLAYQRNGDAFRQRIRNDITTNRSSIVLGHSLGGIITLDALFGADRVPDVTAQVRLVVTYGSQSALLAAIRGLQPLTIPPDIGWLNIYCPHDFASFRAEETFAGAHDEELEMPDIPFPQAHSCYVHRDEFFRMVARHPRWSTGA